MGEAAACSGHPSTPVIAFYPTDDEEPDTCALQLWIGLGPDYGDRIEGVNDASPASGNLFAGFCASRGGRMAMEDTKPRSKKGASQLMNVLKKVDHLTFMRE